MLKYNKKRINTKKGNNKARKKKQKGANIKEKKYEKLKPTQLLIFRSFSLEDLNVAIFMCQLHNM